MMDTILPQRLSGDVVESTADCFLMAIYDELCAIAILLSDGTQVRVCWHHVRAIFEAWVKVLWISNSETKERCKAFFDYHAAWSKRSMEAVNNSDKMIRPDDFDETLAAIRLRFNSTMARRSEDTKTYLYKGKKWAPAVRTMMVETLGEADATAIHETWYSLMSNHCHASSVSLGPTKRDDFQDAVQVYTAAVMFFLQAAEIIERLFGYSSGPFARMRSANAQAENNSESERAE